MKKALIFSAGVFAFMYLIFSFCCWNLSAGDWPREARIAFGIIYGIISLYALIFGVLKDEVDKMTDD